MIFRSEYNMEPITEERYYYLYNAYNSPGPKGGDRNTLCYCNSGKKYKKCCMQQDRNDFEQARKIFNSRYFLRFYQKSIEKDALTHEQAIQAFYKHILVETEKIQSRKKNQELSFKDAVKASAQIAHKRDIL